MKNVFLYIDKIIKEENIDNIKCIHAGGRRFNFEISY
jgi:hypothetical protein